MSSIPSNLARVPNALVSQVLVGSLTRTTSELLRTQIQLATGRALNRPSDDSVAASTISVLDDLIEQRGQRLRNLSHGEALLNNVDAALSDMSDELLEAKSIALSQTGFGSDAQTRANQAVVIDAMIQNLLSISNRNYQDIYYFGGSRTAAAPVSELLGGLRYTGQGDGLEGDYGLSKPLRVTLSADRALGAMSARVAGDRDLDPVMDPATRLVDLNGARGMGVRLGVVAINVGGTQVSADLTSAHSVQDAIDTIQSAIQTIDAGATVGIDGSGSALEIAGNSVGITISDPAGGSTAADLGLAATFAAGGGAGADLDPRITDLTPIANLSGLTLPLGAIRLASGGQVRDVDLAGAQTIQDIRNAIETAGLGARVEIALTGDRLSVINEVSGVALSIGEVGGGQTATQLGIRSFAGSTLLADFNDGLGVEVLSGGVDPLTGAPDPARDLDFRITLRDGSSFDVDLAGATTVQNVVDAVNAAAAGAGLGGTGPGDAFFIRLASDGNGLELLDNTPGGGAGAFSVSSLNGSHAAEHLGILGSTTGATLVGQDRATVAVDSVFSHLIALREALNANDSNGIELAASRLDGDIVRVAEARADIGVRARRVADATLREEDLRLQDTALKSQVQDLDYTEAAVRFAGLQQQLQAALATTSRSTTLSLLDFLT